MRPSSRTYLSSSVTSASGIPLSSPFRPIPKLSSNHPVVEEVAPIAVLDFDNPEIRVILGLAADIGIGIRLGNRGRAGAAHPDELAFRRSRLREHRAAARAAVDLQQHRPGIGIA